LLFSFCVLLLATPPGRGQVPDPGVAAQQEADAARERLLKAADELDMIQANAEANKAALDGMKADLAKMRADNADLRQQLAALQAALDKAEADRAKERQALLDEVAALIAKNNAPHGLALRHDAPPDVPAPSPGEVHTSIRNEVADNDASSTGPVHHASTDSDSASSDTPSAPAPKPKPQKGYYHVVESGETLAIICQAYRDDGVKVTNAQVRKANGLTSKSVLKAGQKLFIPKPAE
jgi:LysM repeat protein